MADEKKAKAEKPKDPDMLPTKVTCTKCGTKVGVRKTVYAKRVEKQDGYDGKLYEDDIEVRHDPAWKKARQKLDSSYLCRNCRPKPVKKAKEKKE